MNKKFAIISFYLVSVLSQAQSRVPIIGRLISKADQPQGVTVTNLSDKQVHSVHSNGVFNVLGEVGDTLYFKDVFGEEYKHVITQRDLEKEVLLIPFEGKYTGEGYGQMLKEINIAKFDAKAIGLDFSGAKKYSAMERQLYTATSSGGGVSLDGIINGMSGRTAMLKKALAYEKGETASERLFYLFSDEELSNKFSIEKDHIKGFAYFLVEDNEMQLLLAEEKLNRRRIEFRISELLGDYKKRVSP